MATLRKYSLFLLVSVLATLAGMTSKKWAEGCAERFPVKGSTVFVKGEIRYDTAYLAPDTLVFTDTVTVDCDSAEGNGDEICHPVANVPAGANPNDQPGGYCEDYRGGPGRSECRRKRRRGTAPASRPRNRWTGHVAVDRYRLLADDQRGHFFKN